MERALAGLSPAFSTQPTSLEIKLQTERNLPRIARGEELPELADPSEVSNAAESRVCRQSIRNRLEDVVEHRVIEDVVELGAELQLVTLAEVEVLRQVRIRVELARKAERRPRRVTNLARQRRAERKWVERVRNAAGRIRRDVIQRITDDVRTSTTSRNRRRTLDHAVQSKTSLRGRDAGDFPTAQQHPANTIRGKAGMERRYFIDITRYENMRTIQTRHRAFEMQVGANLRYVDSIAVVRRVGQRLGPRVSNLRRNTTRRTQAERSQQSVVTRRRAGLPVSNGTEAAERPREVNTVVRVVRGVQSSVATSDALGSRDDFGRGRSVDVHRTNQVIACRTRVTDFKHRVVRNLLLPAQRPLLDHRCDPWIRRRIDATEIAAGRW